MRWALAAAILAGVVALWLIFTSARSYPDDQVSTYHNQPFEVEQQAGQCHEKDENGQLTKADCVTNIGPCVWDPDDYLYARSWDGHLETCQYADWSGQSYRVILTAKSKGGNQDMWVRVTLDPPLDLVGDNAPDLIEGFYYDTIETWDWEKGPWVHVDDCFKIDLTSYGDENVNVYPEVPYQGGGGALLGHAIPLTLTFTFPEGAALTVTKRGTEECP